jgi:tetratricopeptide (TPR) repeat protein
MSARPKTCPDCNRECVPERVAPYPGKGEESTYGVGWRCPQCSKRTLDVCPVGPLVPSETVCLNCGATYPAGGENPTCGACGLPRQDVLAALGVEPVPDDLLAAGRDALRIGLVRRGLALLNLALQRDPSLAEVWSIKCSFLDAMGFTKTKVALLQGALAAGGPSSLWLSYGYALQQLGRHAEAVAAYRRYLEKEPEGPSAGVACCNQANSLVQLGDRAAADELYQRAIALEPNRLTHATNYALFLIGDKRWPEALSVVDAALAKVTADADAIPLLEHRALILAEQENGEEALASADAAVARGSDSGRTHFLRSRALALLGRLEEARDEIQRVLTLDPNNIEGKRALEQIDAVLVWGRMRPPADPG